MADDPYVYPGTRILRNTLEIRDAERLSRTEADVVSAELAALTDQSLRGAYDLAHWQAFHRRIFGKLYPWAGELRTVQIAKPNAFLGQLAREAGHRAAWEHLDHERSFAANVRSLNGQNGPLRALLEAIVDRPHRG